MTTVGQVTYYCFDLITRTLQAELPFNGVTFGSRLNDAGTFSGTLNLRDSRVQQLNPLNGTRPGRTLLAIDVDGALSWLGILWTRRYQSSTGIVTLGGQEIWSYFNYRLQVNDYSTGPLNSQQPGQGFWNFGAASVDPQMVAAAIVADAITAGGNAWTGAGTYGAQLAPPAAPYFGSALSWLQMQVGNATPSAEWITPSYPISQRQSVASIITTLSTAGYGVGFDFGIDPAWSGAPGSLPTAVLNFGYPVRGRSIGATGLIIDLAQDLDYEWDEDATQSLNNLFATASGTGASAGAAGTGLAVGTAIQAQDTTPLTNGYPLMEGTQSYTEVNTQDVLAACAQGDLGQYEWPIAAPQITLPMFSNGIYPSIGDFITGDNMRVANPGDDRFPAGFDTYLRCVAADYVIADHGTSTMKLTFNAPLSAAPVAQAPV